MKKKKVIRNVLIILGGFIFGLIWALFFDQDLFYKMRLGFQKTPWYLYPILVILVFYISLAIHELTHLFAFSVNKIKGRAIYLTGFTFVKKVNQWKFEFHPKMFALMGGLVIPDIKSVKNEEEYNKVVRAFYRSLIAAPIASIIYCFVVLASYLLILFLTNLYVWIAVLTAFTLLTIMLTALYILASLVQTKEAVGDFPAYKKMKNDELFQISLINQYIMFATSSSKETDKFIFDKSIEVLLNQKEYYNQHILSLIGVYLDGVVFDSKSRNEEVDKIVDDLGDYALLRSDAGKVVYFNKLYFIYQEIDSTKALEKFEKRREELLGKDDLKYLVHKAMHLMNISDETEFLNNRENFGSAKMQFVFDPIIDYLEEEKRTNVRLVPKIVEIKEVIS